MKTHELALWLGVATSTLRYWTRNEFKSYLSPTAQGGSGRTRHFTDLDARIIAFVVALKAQSTPINEILTTLNRLQAEDWQDLPPMPAAPPEMGPIAMVPREAAETAVSTQRAALMREIAIQAERIEILETELQNERSYHNQTRSELAEARERLGELRGQLATVDAERASWGQSRRLLLYVAILAALPPAVLLAVVVLLALGVGGM